MAENSNKTLYIILGAVGLLVSCCCFSGVGIFAYATYQEDNASSGPLFADDTGFVPPPGWVQYTQTINCMSSNSGLTLTGFSLHHPADMVVELCTDQQPQAYNYVTLYNNDASGNMTGQFGVGYQTGAPLASLIDQLIGNLQAQMPPGSQFDVVDSSPYAARGNSYIRKDYVLNLTGQLGLMAPGTYAFRVILIPNDDGFSDGLTLILIKRASGPDATAAFTEMDGNYHQSIESIRF